MRLSRNQTKTAAANVEDTPQAEATEDVQDALPLSAVMQKIAEEEARLAAKRARLTPFAAALPEEFFETPISALKIGQMAYVVPWAMEIDSDGLCWISADHPVDLTGGGTACMRITRTEHGFDASLVRDFDHKWSRHKGPLTGNYLPITNLQTQRGLPTG